MGKFDDAQNISKVQMNIEQDLLLIAYSKCKELSSSILIIMSNICAELHVPSSTEFKTFVFIS